MKNNYKIRVLERAVKILDCFTSREPEKSLAAISRETGYNKSTVFRILVTMEELDWIRAVPDKGLYCLDVGLFELGSRAVNGLDFYMISRQYMDELAKKTNLTTHLVIHDNGEVLYLNKMEIPGSVMSTPSNIGLRVPMHCTAVGKTLLAYMTRDRVEEVLKEKGLPAITNNTITSREKLFQELDKIYEQEHAIDHEELQLGVKCVAAPVRDHTGNVVAAISASGLSTNMSDENMVLVVDEVKKAAEGISYNLGYIIEYSS